MSGNESPSENSKLADEEKGSKSLDKARNRMVAEGYKYQSLHDDSDSDSDTVKNRKGWNKPNNVLISIIIISIVIIAILAAVVGYQYLKRRHVVCTTAECVKVSAYITNKMDTFSNPCEDFYQYACGNWDKTTVIPATMAKYGVFQQIAREIKKKLKLIIESNSTLVNGHNSEAVKNMKDYYKLCMDTETIERRDSGPVNKFITTLGSWTISSPQQWNQSAWSLTDSLVQSSYYGFFPLFAMSVKIDEKNSSKTVMSFSQAGLTLGSHEQYFKNNTKYESLRKAFIDFGTRLGEILGGNTADSKQKMTEIYEFEQKIAEIFTPAEERQDPVKSYNKIKIKELQDKIGNVIDVHQYLSTTLNRSVGLDEELVTDTPKYFTQLSQLISKTPKSVLANYIVWHAINLLVGYLPDKFIDAAIILEEAEKGVSKLDPRWQRCMGKAGSFGFALGALYVQDYFTESSKKDVSNIIEQIRTAFIKNLPTVKWMDKQTRDRAMDKAAYISKKIGYPDWILNVTKLDDHYDDITITPGQFFESHLSILRFYRHKILETLGKPPDHNKWSMAPTTVNAYYSPSLNGIVFPAAILQVPFYSPDFPISFNYGTAGTIMGHELTHGFDNTGRNFDKYGNLDNWWTNASADGFKEQTSCMINQYSKYMVEGLHIRGDRTLGENIADNGGLKLAHLAYKYWLNSNNPGSIKDFAGLDYTHEQLFFIGFAQLWCSHYTPSFAKESILTDVHTYAKYRVIGTLSNNQIFANAFKCPKNSLMNPEHKCEVW